MKNLKNSVETFVRKLPEDKFDLLADKVNDVLVNKQVNRAARRRLARNWAKYGRRRLSEA